MSSSPPSQTYNYIPRLRIWDLLIGIILWLGFLLRLNRLGERSLWFDESIEYWMASAPINEIHIAVSTATHDPPFYSYLLHIWQRLGTGEFWMRTPSLFFSVLAIACVIRLSSQALGKRAGIVAGLLMTVSAADIRYAQEVGQYALMVFLVALNLIFLYEALTRHDWFLWMIWGITASIAIYTHYGSVIIVAATAFVVLITQAVQRRWAIVWRQIMIGMIAIVSLIPLITYVIPRQLNRLGATTQPIDLTQFLTISRSIIQFQFMGNQLGGWSWPTLPMAIVWVPAMVAILFAIVNSKSIIDWPILFIATWIVYYLVGTTGSYFFSGSRHSLLVTPIFYIVLGLGIVKLHDVWRIGSVIVFGLLMIISVFAPVEGQEDIRGSTIYLLENRSPNDPIYVYYGAVPGFRYQLEQATNKVENVPATWYLDCMGLEIQNYCHTDNIFYGRWFRSMSLDEKRASIISSLGFAPERFWIIFSHVHSQEHLDIVEILSDEYQVIQKRNDGGETAMLLNK